MEFEFWNPLFGRLLEDIELETKAERLPEEVDLDDHIPEIVRFIRQGVEDAVFSMKTLRSLKLALKVPDEPGMKIENLMDKMKFEYMCKVFDKYTLEELETLLPE